MALPLPDLDLIADQAVGIEQQLIELVNRRATAGRGSTETPDLDAAIAELQDRLGELTERLPVAGRPEAGPIGDARICDASVTRLSLGGDLRLGRCRDGHEVPPRSAVNVTVEGSAIVVEPTGDFDDRAAHLVAEVVAIARRACLRAVVDLRALAPGHHDGFRLLPVIARDATVRRTPPR